MLLSSGDKPHGFRSDPLLKVYGSDKLHIIPCETLIDEQTILIILLRKNFHVK